MATIPKLPNQPSEQELTDFLNKVDQIESVIKGLNSEDPDQRNLYMTKADTLIEQVSKKDNKKDDGIDDDEEDGLPKTKTGFSKTSINKDAYRSDPPQPAVLQEPIDQRSFMAAMEADAKERSERRKVREKLAAEYKEQGNAEFRQENYGKALELYDQAINQVRDNTALYTNRAQTKIKLGLFSEALTDCDWALRVWPSCMKAYVYKGHAYLGLTDYENARESYRHILTIDSKKESLVREYLADVDRKEQANKENSKADQLFKEGNQAAKNVVDLLTSINKKEQLPLYYAGGFRVITSHLDSVDSQSLFRTNGGLQLPVTHDILKRCLSASILSLSKEERDMLSATLDMFTASCKDNETSQQQLLELPHFSNQLLAMLEVKFKGQGRLLKASCLNFLHEVSVTPAGRAAIISKFDVARLITVLLQLMMKNSTYSSTAAALLNNIALDKRMKTMLRDNIQTDILPAFENMLESNKSSSTIVGLACSTATNLAGDVTIRNKMASRPSVWKYVANLLISYTGSRQETPVEHLLGLLVNLSTGVDSKFLRNVSHDVTVACCTVMSADLGDMALTRSIAVLANIAPHCDDAVAFLCTENRPLTILELMKRPDPLFYKPALKCMARLSQEQETAAVVVANKGTSVLLNFLNSEDEVTIGNAALCLSHLCQIDKFCAKLTKTNIIQKLLMLARDGKKPAVQSNCAILIGKLVQGDARHLDKLRELHGVEILHGCMKHVK
ncbi:hypothetical protein BsWGS_25548 [Bradybaena similaris]